MPPASSIRGHVELLRRDFYWKKCPEWTKKYGPVISVWKCGKGKREGRHRDYTAACLRRQCKVTLVGPPTLGRQSQIYFLTKT
ncbi:hypothetical protein HPB50_018708 [Hyalomma asiaticum]|uniref:Uncharacterized protein n=1 Tax=Hyalomma asiaticum TaxID=266040 RepID=A0ACB7RYF6_HYAAI|nr:hypothetical protein HPB50_018708 [Hyalomma asiaticum]